MKRLALLLVVIQSVSLDVFSGQSDLQEYCKLSNRTLGCAKCDRRCSDLKDPLVPLDEDCAAKCAEPECQCLPAHVFDDNYFNCVLPEDCSPTCGPDEVFRQICTGGDYAIQKCSDLQNDTWKEMTPVCLDGCACKETLLRNDNGTCVRPHECPNFEEKHLKQVCQKENTTYGCAECNRYCSSLIKTATPLEENCAEKCEIPDCQCLPTHVFDDNFYQCVLPEDCSPTCGSDEGFMTICSGGDNPIRECSDFLDETWLDRTPECRIGCACLGMLRADNGTCINPEDCPGYDSCREQNARRSKGEFCNRRCPNHERNPDLCDGQDLKDGCDCIPPYLYDYNLKKCVHPDKCTDVCGPGLEFSHDCMGAGCRVTQCWERDRLPGCFDVISHACVQGCVCSGGKLRAENGTCVLPEDCPPKTEEHCQYPYSVPGCGTNCNRKCSNYNKEPEACDEECIPNGCDCAPPFVYKESVKECVPPQLCNE